MLTFTSFLSESKYEYLFHGTSSVYSADIKKYGLLPSQDTHKNTKQNGVYLTTEYGLACREAGFTVKGENGEDGASGRPMVVVVDRKKVKNLRKDDEYHAYDRMTDNVAFWTPSEIPSDAIVDVVPASSSKYKDVNAAKIAKQIGLLDKDGNKIIDLDGNIPEIRTSDKNLFAYLGSDSTYPDPFGNWTTSPNSESLEDSKYTLMVHGRPEEFEVIDQMRSEVILKPSPKVLRTSHTVPKGFKRQ